MNNRILPIVFVTAFALSACSDNKQEEPVPLAEVPENIVTIVQNALPGISLTEAQRKVAGDIVIYELEGKLINGREYEMKIADDGTIIEIELED